MMFFKKNNKLAVAMQWDGRGAPKVTAKGHGLVAEEIISLAQKHEVPIRADHDLVRVLSTVELNDEVPEQLYLAVAEIIAFAYTIKGELTDKLNEKR